MRKVISGGLLVALLVSGCGGGGGSSPAPAPPPPPRRRRRTLFVATQPLGGVPPTAFTTQPVVHVRSNGVTDAGDDTTVVTAAMVPARARRAPRSPGATTATAVAGVATFTNLGVSLAGTGYQLRFTATGFTEASSNTFSVIELGQVIPPSTPPASQVNFAIDSTQDVRPISRFIYGMNGWDPAGGRANLTLSRSGGNRMTAYNWETNASNAGADFQPERQLPGRRQHAERRRGTGPRGRARCRRRHDRHHTHHRLRGGGQERRRGDVNQPPTTCSTRFHQSPARKGSAFTLTPDTADAFVYQDEYINFLDQTYPGAFAAATIPS